MTIKSFFFLRSPGANLIAILAIVGFARQISAQEISTAAAVPVRENPFAVTYVKDFHESKFETTYNLKWDFGDIKHIVPGVRNFIFNPFASLKQTTWDITDMTRVRVYGVSMNPWKMLIDRETVRYDDKAVGPGVSSSSGTSAGFSPHGAVERRRFRFALGPVLSDMKIDVRKEIKKELLNQSFRAMGPQGRGLDHQGRQDFLGDIMRVGGVWDISDPLGISAPLQFLIDKSTPVKK